MRFIAIITVCLGLISTCLAAPQQFMSFPLNSAGPLNFGFNEPMSARFDFNAGAALRKEEIPEGFRKFYEQSGIQEPQLRFNQQLENKPQESLRFTAPFSGVPITPEANSRSSPGFGFGSFKDFTAEFNTLLPKGNANSLLLPKGDNLLSLPRGNANLTPLPKEASNFPSFLRENTGSPLLPKSDENPQFLPKDDPNSQQFLKANSESLNLPKSAGNLLTNPVEQSKFQTFLKGNPNFQQQFFKGNAEFPSMPKSGNNPFLPTGMAIFPPFLNGNTDFSSLTKSDANLPSTPKDNDNAQPMSKTPVNFPPFPTGNAEFPFLSKSGNNPFLPKGNAAFSPFLNGNSNFLSLTKSGANLPSAPKENNAQPLPKSDIIFPPFPKGNAGFLPASLPKSDSNRSPSPKDDANFSPFPIGNAAFLSLPKSDFNPMSLPKSASDFMSFLKENTNFSSLFKNSFPFPKNAASFPSQPKSVDLKMTPAGMPQGFPAPPQGFPGNAPEQRDAAGPPEPVTDTPEVAAARAAHLQTVAETASKLAEPVKETPEVLAAREAHLRAAADPKSAPPAETPKYTPEVQAARDAHFRAYELAAKLAAESDANPKILEILLGRPGEPKTGPLKIEDLVSLIESGKSGEELKRLMDSGKPPMNVEATIKNTERPMESSPESSENKGINNLAEKPQLKDALKSPAINLGTGISTASTRITLPDTKLSSLSEFEQSKLHAVTDLSCGTTLKVKEVSGIKPTEDQRFVIIKAAEPGALISTVSLPINQLERWKNWAIQYVLV